MRSHGQRIYAYGVLLFPASFVDLVTQVVDPRVAPLYIYLCPCTQARKQEPPVTAVKTHLNQGTCCGLPFHPFQQSSTEDHYKKVRATGSVVASHTTAWQTPWTRPCISR